MGSHLQTEAPNLPDSVFDDKPSEDLEGWTRGHGSWADEVEGMLYSHSSLPREVSRGDTSAARTLDSAPLHRRLSADSRRVPEVSTEPLLEYISHATDGIDLPDVLRGKYSDDVLFACVLEGPSHHKNFEYEDGLLYLKERGATSSVSQTFVSVNVVRAKS